MSRISLQDFAATWTEQQSTSPPWVVPESHIPDWFSGTPLRRQLDDVIDTVVSVQRATALQEGLYLGPTTVPALYRTLLDCSATLHTGVPTAVITNILLAEQAVFGSDHQAFCSLSMTCTKEMPATHQRFFLGQLLGQLAAQHVSANTLFSLVVDHAGLRKTARQAVGPIFEVALAPIGLALRLGLARWHRAAQLTADRAGLICAGDFDSAGSALLRLTLGKDAPVEPRQFIAHAARQPAAPGQWAELMATKPWLHKRLVALELFSRSELYHRLVDRPMDNASIDDDTLSRRTTELLGVG